MAARYSRIPVALGAVFLVLGLGTVGYRVLEGWPWFDCFYMTLITLSTIGFGEHPGMTNTGRVFTSFIIIGGVGSFGLAISALFETALQVTLLDTWEKRRMHEKIDKLRNHVIVCGVGRVGTTVARGLAAEGASFVVIDIDKDRLQLAAEHGWPVLLGDARQEEVLLRAGIGHAKALVTSLESDADNVFVVLTARDLAPAIRIVARVSDENSTSKVRKAGADDVVSPIRMGANQILQSVVRPSVAYVMDSAFRPEDFNLLVDEILITEESRLAGKSLRASHIRRDFNVIVIAILRHGQEELVFNPDGEMVVHPGDKLIAIGSRGNLVSLIAEARKIVATP